MKTLVVKRKSARRLREDAAFFAFLCRENGIRMNIINHEEEYVPRGNEILIFVSIKEGRLQRKRGETCFFQTNLSNMQFEGCMLDTRFPKEGGDIALLTKEGNIFGYYYEECNVFLFSDITHYTQNSSSFYEEVIKLIKHFAGAKCRLSRKLISPERVKITLGADPEFVLKSTDGMVVYASTVYDSLDDPIGRDGAGLQLELRPSPSNMPEGLLAEMKRLFVTVVEDGYIVTLSQCASLGGHIHIGGLKPTKELLRLLDLFLLPLAVLNSQTRKQSSYFSLSKCEEKEWGFEYRTPPAEMWWHPELAKATLRIVKAVCEKYANSQVIVRGFSSIEEIEYYTENNINNPFTYKIVSNLIALVGKRVTRKFLHYIRAFSRNVEDSFLSYWGININKKLGNSVVRFSDDTFSACARDVIRSILSKASGWYYVFGLRRDRGLVWTSNIRPTGSTKYWVDPDTLNISLRSPSDDFNIIIGLPYELRTIDDLAQSQAVRQILAEIYTTFKIRR